MLQILDTLGRTGHISVYRFCCLFLQLILKTLMIRCNKLCAEMKRYCSVSKTK